jgi:hypothetical protein
MVKDEVNELFRILVRRIMAKGFKITAIGRLIFGPAAYSQIQKFMRGLDEKESANPAIEFGYSPLAKIGKALDYNLHLVYIKTNDNEFNQIVTDRNVAFSKELETNILNYLEDSIDQKTLLTEKERIAKAVDELLDML